MSNNQKLFTPTRIFLKEITTVLPRLEEKRKGRVDKKGKNRKLVKERKKEETEQFVDKREQNAEKQSNAPFVCIFDCIRQRAFAWSSSMGRRAADTSHPWHL
ncbi:hypothetical protein Y032_0345g3109 [Ancylostoma ceylanicum]|uniref:Uncharacterized protein n=1 Tax=Ancylostoma ceylanicum TaxID=53326 RepID=A0A016RXG1_9BILA|nr:hypothetical protein Y032_0345g3109 [Ancylostoma ceylanicum]